MNCLNTGCTIFNGCKIKEVAHHCIIHQKMVLAYGDTIEKNAELSVNVKQNEPEKSNNVYNGNG